MARKINRNERLESRARKDRHEGDRTVSDDRLEQDDERLEEFRNTLYQSVLPDLPKIPGYHVIWLSTTNPQDQIQARMRLGYTPIRPSDVPDAAMAYASMKTAQLGECICINEMIGFKIESWRYEKMMRIAHHERPLDEEQGIRDRLAQKKEEMAAEGLAVRGLQVELEGDMEDLGKAPEPPSFAKAAGDAV